MLSGGIVRNHWHEMGLNCDVNYHVHPNAKTIFMSLCGYVRVIYLLRFHKNVKIKCAYFNFLLIISVYIFLFFLKKEEVKQCIVSTDGEFLKSPT